MAQTRDNGAIVPTNSDDYNPTEDLSTMADSLSVVTPVANQAARDALTKFVGRTVRRLDVSGSLEYWDGSLWVPELISVIYSNASTLVPTTGGGPGALTLDVANSQNAGFVTSPGAGQIQVVLAGVYSFTWHANSLAGTSGYMSVKNQTGTGTYFLTNYGPAGEQSVTIPNLYLAAGSVVSFVMGPSANVTIGSTIRVSKIS